MPTPFAPHGIHAILYAFFDAAERLDRAAMRKQVDLSIAAGAHGIAALGLATEVSKLSEAERRTVMDWAGEDVAGRVPLGFTIFGNSVAEQTAQVKHAEAAGANWVILQPPMAGSYAPAEYVAFFGCVADATALPVAIQNAPAYLGRGLTPDEIAGLAGAHANIRIIKGEGPAIDIARLVETCGPDIKVFNGRGGLEFTDNLRFGCAGLILAPDLLDYAVRAYNAFRAGDEAGAETLYRSTLPAITFVMQSIETLICYGKRLFAERAGLEVFDRAPALRPSEAGLLVLDRLTKELGPFAAPPKET